MTEYQPDDHHGDAHDLVPDVPDHPADDPFDPPHPPPLDDLHPADGTPSAELHFPGDEVTPAQPEHAADPGAGLDADPAAAWPDDDGFSHWLQGAEPTGVDDDPAADVQLRDELTAPADEAGGLPSADALVDWTLRELGGDA